MYVLYGIVHIPYPRHCNPRVLFSFLGEILFEWENWLIFFTLLLFNEKIFLTGVVLVFQIGEGSIQEWG